MEMNLQFQKSKVIEKLLRRIERIDKNINEIIYFYPEIVNDPFAKEVVRVGDSHTSEFPYRYTVDRKIPHEVITVFKDFKSFKDSTLGLIEMLKESTSTEVVLSRKEFEELWREK